MNITLTRHSGNLIIELYVTVKPEPEYYILPDNINIYTSTFTQLKLEQWVWNFELRSGLLLLPKQLVGVNSVISASPGQYNKTNEVKHIHK